MSVTTQHVPAVIGRYLVPADSIWRLTVDQYHEMIRAGILTEDDPIELLEGWLVKKMSKNPPHCVANEIVRDALAPILPAGWFVTSQEPITTEDSEPEPDVAVIRGTRRQYLSHHPLPKDVGLLIEVADTSLERDREFKKPLYARARIPVYWIVNLLERKIEVYTNPTGPAEKPDYGQRQDYGENDSIPVVIDGKEVDRLAVQDLLP